MSYPSRRPEPSVFVLRILQISRASGLLKTQHGDNESLPSQIESNRVVLQCAALRLRHKVADKTIVATSCREHVSFLVVIQTLE